MHFKRTTQVHKKKKDIEHHLRQTVSSQQKTGRRSREKNMNTPTHQCKFPLEKYHKIKPLLDSKELQNTYKPKMNDDSDFKDTRSQSTDLLKSKELQCRKSQSPITPPTMMLFQDPQKDQGARQQLINKLNEKLALMKQMTSLHQKQQAQLRHVMSSKEMHRLCKIHSVEKIDMLGQLKAIKKKIEQGKH